MGTGALTPGDRRMISRGKAAAYRRRAEEYQTTADNYRQTLAHKKATNPLYKEGSDFCKLAEIEFAQWIHSYEQLAANMIWMADNEDEKETERLLAASK